VESTQVAYAALFEAHKRVPTSRLLALAGRERNATIALMPVFQFTLFASFCIFPPTSLAIFKCFRCDEVSDGARDVWYLAADYSIRCGGAAYAANMAYACAMVAVYPLGVPLLYATMLYPGQEKSAQFPPSKAPISAVFRSFRLIFGRAIISRNALEARMLFPERARAEHSR
jgi:hypothetical protein